MTKRRSVCYASGMSLTLPDFIAGIKTPVEKLTVSQLREREEVWRSLWSWTDENVKQFVLKAGTTVRIMKRNYQGTVGELGAVTFEPRMIEVITNEKTYNYNDGKYYFEEKVIQFPYTTIAWVEGIITSTMVEPEPQPSIEEIPLGEGET
ncbi:MAG: hypothetical protein HWN68_20570 [Desulfobacterales bacterium]|nr:hypothetical protein [Desulfobacterales bacterium]